PTLHIIPYTTLFRSEIDNDALRKRAKISGKNLAKCLCSQPSSGWAANTMPAVAATESWKPTSCTSSGQILRFTMVDSDKSGRAWGPRPKNSAQARIAPILPARRIDGCIPTTGTKSSSVERNAAITSGRGKRKLLNSSVAALATSEVWAPDTADK